MAKQLDPKVGEVLKSHGFGKDAVWDCHGTWVVYHNVLEQIAARSGIHFDPPIVLEADSMNKCAAICVTGTNGDLSEWSIGEAAPSNNKNAYPFAMAEKRAKDRVILKLIGIHGLVYSEEEADDFKQNGKQRDLTSKDLDWRGPLNKTQLTADVRTLVTRLGECETPEDVEKLTDEYVAIIDQCKHDLPSWWAGGPSEPAEFVPLKDRIERAREAQPPPKPVTFWERDSYAVPKKGTWPQWEAKMHEAIKKAPNLDGLTKLQNDNRETLEAFSNGNSDPHKNLMQAFVRRMGDLSQEEAA